MNNILIINLKRHGDIIQSSHLINSIKSKHPKCRIGILVFEEFKTSASIISNIDNIYTIPRKEIITFYKNDIYSDGFGLNRLSEVLNLVCKKDWNEILNYSNDFCSTFLTSYLAIKLNAETRGIAFNNKRNIVFSNRWSIVLNDITTTFNNNPFSFNDCYHQLLDLEHETQTDIIKSNIKHDDSAASNFQKLREAQGINSKIIGIQLKSSSDSKELSLEQTTELLRYLTKDKNIIPVLLTAPFEIEKQIANQLNAKFDNKLISVESDLIALPSVLKSLDLLITPDTLVKHLADALKTPLLELSIGEAPLFKQGTINTQSTLLTCRVNLRALNSNPSKEPRIIVKDIYHSALFTLGLIDLEEVKLNSNFCLYKPKKDSGGSYLIPISGDFEHKSEFQRLMSRELLYKITKADHKQHTIQCITELISEDLITPILKEEKDSISLVTKDLLNTLRYLIQTQENTDRVKGFIASLSTLLEHCEKQFVCSIPVIYFRAKLESIKTTKTVNNFKEVEYLLYELKDNIQLLLKGINDLEKEYLSKKQFAATQRVRSSNPQLASEL